MAPVTLALLCLTLNMDFLLYFSLIHVFLWESYFNSYIKPVYFVYSSSVFPYNISQKFNGMLISLAESHLIQCEF